jgi:hypothetical protein
LAISTWADRSCFAQNPHPPYAERVVLCSCPLLFPKTHIQANSPNIPFVNLPVHYSTSVQLDVAASRKVPSLSEYKYAYPEPTHTLAKPVAHHPTPFRQCHPPLDLLDPAQRVVGVEDTKTLSSRNAGAKSRTIGDSTMRFSRNGRANEWRRSEDRVPHRVHLIYLPVSRHKSITCP